MTTPPVPVDPSLFDRSTSPAEDFFRYVNGGWLDANPVPPEYSAWGAFHEVNERNQTLLRRLLEAAAADAPPREAISGDEPSRLAGAYYSAAMDEDAIAAAGTEPLEPMLERITAASSVADVRDVVRDLQRMGVSALYSLGIAPDFEDASAYLAYVGQGGLGLPERDYYLRDDEHSVALRAAYVDHVATQLRNLGGTATGARDTADAILAFETRLAEPSLPAEKMRDVQLTMNRHDVSALDGLMPTFGLSGHVADLGVTQPTVNVDNPGFFSALDTTLSETPIETLRAYLRFHLVRSYASSLSPAFEQASFDFYSRTLGGQQEMRPRWKRALEAATNDIGEAVAQLYVTEAFSEGAKRRCEEMVEHILSAMGQAIRGAEWMTGPTKEQALEKLAGFSYKIGFPERWRDYSALTLVAGPYAENRMRCAAFEYDREMGRLEEGVDRSEWEMPAHAVNAYYHPLLNEIVFPAGILQPPFFYAEADDAVNFGAIGAVIAHEITHGFDDQGSRFDAEGSLREWWTEADRTEFERRAQVLVEQFDRFEVADGLTVNGRLTLGENIADLGGVRIALAALRETLTGDEPLIDGFTTEQRFFLAYAAVWRMNMTDEYARLLVNVDPHSPARFRVNGPLANLPDFADAFDLPHAATMRLDAERQASVW